MPAARRPAPSAAAALTAALAAACTVGLAGCGSTPTQTPGLGGLGPDTPAPAGAAAATPAPAAPVIDPIDAAALNFDVRWTHDLAMDPGQTVARLLVSGGLVIVIEEPVNLVTALELRSGRTLWKSVVGSRLDSMVGVSADDRDVFVNSPNRLYRLARRSGEVKEIQNLQYVVSGSPLRLDRRVVFGSDEGVVFAHHLDDGYSKWAYALTSPVRVQPVAGDGQVFVVDDTGHYAMLGTNGGRLRWRGQTYGPVTAPVEMHEGFVLMASEDQSLYSLSEVTGRDRWPAFRSEARLSTGPVAAGNTVYLREPGRGLSAVAADTGEARWFYPGDVAPLSVDAVGPLVAGPGVLLRLDGATGEPVHAITVPNLSKARDVDGGLVLLGRNGRMAGLAPVSAGGGDRTAASR